MGEEEWPGGIEAFDRLWRPSVGRNLQGETTKHTDNPLVTIRASRIKATPLGKTGTQTRSKDPSQGRDRPREVADKGGAYISPDTHTLNVDNLPKKEKRVWAGIGAAWETVSLASFIGKALWEGESAVTGQTK